MSTENTNDPIATEGCAAAAGYALERVAKLWGERTVPPRLEVGTSAVFSPVRLLVSAEVRYWEDAEINGIQDTEEGDNIPLKVGNLWKPRIELETGRVLDWPQGTTADIHYKVCDQGEYWLEDADGKRLKWKGSYVPNDLLAIGDNGYGDYIILKIAAEGIIVGWEVPTLDAADWENDKDQRTGRADPSTTQQANSGPFAAS